jgi:hypothetical protein
VRAPLTALLAVPLLGPGPAAAAAAGAPASIVRIQLGSEAEEQHPYTVPTESGDTVEVDFPWPIADWAGRGFTPDPGKFAGDFVVEAARGNPRIFVTPVAEKAHRVLHVILAEPGGGTRSLPVEFVPAPPGLAWRKLVFGAPGAGAEAAPMFRLAAAAPRSPFRQPGPDSEIGLLRTLRLMVNTTESGAQAIAAATPSLRLQRLDPAPLGFGEFTLTNRFAVRDGTTDMLGLCVSVANASAHRLAFDPESWVVRAGDRVYPVRTVSFAGELEPGASAPAFLVVGRGPDGEPTRLLPDNAFRISVQLTGSVNPRPVRRLPLFGPSLDE